MQGPFRLYWEKVRKGQSRVEEDVRDTVQGWPGEERLCLGFNHDLEKVFHTGAWQPFKQVTIYNMYGTSHVILSL